jgi:hypothetical protein
MMDFLIKLALTCSLVAGAGIMCLGFLWLGCLLFVDVMQDIKDLKKR